MSNPEHIARLKEGVERWNQWREQNPDVIPDLMEEALIEQRLSGVDFHKADLRWTDLTIANLTEANLCDAVLCGANLAKANLSRADLTRADLRGADLNKADLDRVDLDSADLISAKLTDATLVEANLRRCNLVNAKLTGANLSGSDLRMADLREADLSRAKLHQADLSWAHLPLANLSQVDLRGARIKSTNLSQANLTAADLRDANLCRADLSRANLSGANLTAADLSGTLLVRTNLERASLTSCCVYGIAVWDVNLKGAIQSNLIITRQDQSVIQVDNLEVAQFIYLLLNNERLRHVIDTITSKVVLILGRFTPERKVVLDAIREDLREKGYLPVLFDFEKPVSKDLMGTISTLANMARFIIADLTDPASVPHELATVVPGTVVPVQAILLEGQREYAMFVDLATRYHWVLEPYQYETKELLLAHLSERVIAPAEAKAKQLTRK